MPKILIKNGKVWDGERFYFADILTENEKIAKIADKICETAEFEYDASGKIVSAGLVDAHVHMRGINKEFGIHAELSSIPFGVTAAADACGAYGDKALLDTFLLKNVIFVPAELRNNKAYFDSAEKMLGKYKEKAIGIKVYFDTQISEVKDIKPLCEVVEFAEANNLIVMVHSSNSPVSMAELLGVLRKGDILTHAYHGGTNNVSEDGFKCIKTAKKNNMRVRVIGEINRLAEPFQKKIRELEETSAHHTGLNLTIAINYGSRDEMIRAMKHMAEDVQHEKLQIEQIDESLFASYLDTKDLPDPDLLIRTSGEQRLSNYLLWQLAYSEFYFTDVPWPDFHKEELLEAVKAYSKHLRMLYQTHS